MKIDEALMNFFSALSEKEQTTLYSFLSKAKKTGEVTGFSIIHNMLKLDIDNLNEVIELSSSMKAPSLLKQYSPKEKVVLPIDHIPLSEPLDVVLNNRESKRAYTGEPLTLQELSTLLYFSYGVRGYTTAYGMEMFPLRMGPSSGGLQAIELYIFVNKVKEVAQGLYHYNPFDNSIELLEEGNFRRKIVKACTTSDFVDNASVVLVLSCVIERVILKYTLRSYKVIHMDVGFVGENIYLVGTALGLGVCAMAGFFDDKVDELLRINGKDEFVGLLMAVGKLS